MLEPVTIHRKLDLLISEQLLYPGYKAIHYMLQVPEILTLRIPEILSHPAKSRKR